MRKDILPQWMECLFFYIIFSLHLCKIDIRKFPLFYVDITKSKTIMKTEKESESDWKGEVNYEYSFAKRRSSRNNFSKIFGSPEASGRLSGVFMTI